MEVLPVTNIKYNVPDGKSFAKSQQLAIILIYLNNRMKIYNNVGI